MHDNADMVKVLEVLIEELIADRLRIVHMQSSSPVKEKDIRPFQDYKEFEYTGDLYINLHFFRKAE